MSSVSLPLPDHKHNRQICWVPFETLLLLPPCELEIAILLCFACSCVHSFISQSCSCWASFKCACTWRWYVLCTCMFCEVDAFLIAFFFVVEWLSSECAYFCRFQKSCLTMPWAFAVGQGYIAVVKLPSSYFSSGLQMICSWPRLRKYATALLLLCRSRRAKRKNSLNSLYRGTLRAWRNRPEISHCWFSMINWGTEIFVDHYVVEISKLSSNEISPHDRFVPSSLQDEGILILRKFTYRPSTRSLWFCARLWLFR